MSSRHDQLQRGAVEARDEGGTMGASEPGGADPFSNSEATSSPVSTDRAFQVEELTPSMEFMRVILLQITQTDLSISTLSYDPLPSPSIDSLHNDFPLASTDGPNPEFYEDVSKVMVLDIGQLMSGYAFDDRARVFQVNTSHKICILRAVSEAQKKKICNLIRVTADLLRVSGSPPAPDHALQKHTLESIKHSVEEYTTLIEKYETQIDELKIHLTDKTSLLESLTHKFQQLDETNATIMTLLKKAQKQNGLLTARMAQIDRSSQDAADKIEVMQKKIEERRAIMKEKSDLVGVGGKIRVPGVAATRADINVILTRS
ncbi:hypothetical protein HDV00_002510 [Rhizophlyctis rosea]|nr:hypothetical protein HDV00_002510 [Rhizophlyctis rosea]